MLDDTRSIGSPISSGHGEEVSGLMSANCPRLGPQQRIGKGDSKVRGATVTRPDLSFCSPRIASINATRLVSILGCQSG